MDLQLFLTTAFRSWKPKAPDVVERTKGSVTLDWRQNGPFGFLAGDFIYKIERNNKIPRWVVVYSGGKTRKLIDYLASSHPYRFRVRVILKADATPTLADKCVAHYGEVSSVVNVFRGILRPDDLIADEELRDDKHLRALTQESQDSPKQRDNEKLDRSIEKQWLDSSWSDETWSSTDADGTSAVCFNMAVRCGYVKQVQVMLEERSSLIGIVNPTTGFTPLATAVKKGDVGMVKFLIAAGAEVDQQSTADQTALHLAVLGRHPDIVEFLLEKGADFEARDVNGLRVEHYAVDSCDLDMIKLVLDKGGDVHSRDYNGWTPLFRAMCQGANTEIVVELLKRGSDPDIKDLAGLPLTSVARLLKNRHFKTRDSVLRLVDSQYPHEKALANFTRLTKKIYNVHTVFK